MARILHLGILAVSVSRGKTGHPAAFRSRLRFQEEQQHIMAEQTNEINTVQISTKYEGE